MVKSPGTPGVTAEAVIYGHNVNLYVLISEAYVLEADQIVGHYLIGTHYLVMKDHWGPEVV